MLVEKEVKGMFTDQIWTSIFTSCIGALLILVWIGIWREWQYQMRYAEAVLLERRLVGIDLVEDSMVWQNLIRLSSLIAENCGTPRPRLTVTEKHPYMELSYSLFFKAPVLRMGRESGSLTEEEFAGIASSALVQYKRRHRPVELINYLFGIRCLWEERACDIIASQLGGTKALIAGLEKTAASMREAPRAGGVRRKLRKIEKRLATLRALRVHPA